MPRPKNLREFPQEMHTGYGPYSATVEYCRDGDTAVVIADVGLDTYPVVAVRLEDVNAPESWQP